MLYLILIISILNTVLIIYLLKELRKEKDKIAELLDESISEKELRSEEDKKHIDDMLKMREMYESD
jgi:cell division protein FtsL